MSLQEEVRRTVTIANKQGLHARPAAEFVKLAKSFDAEIYVIREDVEVNGKSILGLMMLAAEFGAELTIRADGSDADAAVDGLCALVATGFGE
ncbi:MAG TPA: HPr family phosphocarrier protein [Longimicrobiales bacterium]|nr:HPr family phosphocarrier protein [Longimicrobiales bacterium]